MERVIRVIIADNKWRTRQSLRALLESIQTYSPEGEPVRIEVVGDANDGQEVLNCVQHHDPAVVIMDVTMPGMDGLETTHLIKVHYPHTRVIILTLYDGLRSGAAAAGADVFLIKGCPTEDLLKAIVEHHEGQLAE